MSTSLAWADHFCQEALKDKTLLKLESYYDGVRYVNLNTLSTQKEMLQIAESITNARQFLHELPQPTKLTVLLYNYFPGQAGHQSLAINPRLAPIPGIVYHEYGHLVFLNKLYKRFEFLKPTGDDTWADIYFAGKHREANEIAMKVWNPSLAESAGRSSQPHRMKSGFLNKVLKAENRAQQQWMNFENRHHPDSAISPVVMRLVNNASPYANLFADLVAEIMMKGDGNEVARMVNDPTRAFNKSAALTPANVSKVRDYLWNLHLQQVVPSERFIKLVAEAAIRSLERTIASKDFAMVSTSQLESLLIEQVQVLLTSEVTPARVVNSH